MITAENTHEQTAHRNLKDLTDDQLFALYEEQVGGRLIAETTPIQQRIVDEVDRRAS